MQSSDREWFAGPLKERGIIRIDWLTHQASRLIFKGSTNFSHFNLACVDFRRATYSTPKEWMENRKLSHTVRLVRLLDFEDGKPFSNYS